MNFQSRGGYNPTACNGTYPKEDHSPYGTQEGQDFVPTSIIEMQSWEPEEYWKS